MFPGKVRYARFGWKGLPEKNTPAYLAHLQVTKKKSFTKLPCGGTVTGLLIFVTDVALK